MSTSNPDTVNAPAPEAPSSAPDRQMTERAQILAIVIAILFSGAIWLIIGIISGERVGHDQVFNVRGQITAVNQDSIQVQAGGSSLQLRFTGVCPPSKLLDKKGWIVDVDYGKHGANEFRLKAVDGTANPTSHFEEICKAP